MNRVAQLEPEIADDCILLVCAYTKVKPNNTAIYNNWFKLSL